jgi:hypothetical protein
LTGRPSRGFEEGALHQRHSDAADHAAGALARGEARIDDAARPIGPERAADPNGADVGIDCDLGKDSTEGVHRMAASDLGIALHGGDSLDRLARARHDVAIGLAWRRIATAAQPALVPFDVVERRAEPRGCASSKMGSPKSR